jgi:hypothetical protein
MIYEGITRADYDNLEGVNWSKLKHFKDSIKRGVFMMENERKDTAAMRFGRALHVAVLEPKKFNYEFIIGRGPKHEKGKYKGQEFGSDTKTFKEWLSKQPKNKEYLNTNEYNQVKKLYEVINSHQEVKFLLEQSELKECALTWVDPETGIKCKCLIDFGSSVNCLLGDLKSISKELTYDNLSKEIFQHDYYGQFSFYNTGAIQNGLNPLSFKVIWIQTNDENDCAVSNVGEQTMHYGKMLYEKCLANYQKSLNGEKSGFHKKEFDLDVPYWAMDEFMDLEESGIQFEEVI